MSTNKLLVRELGSQNYYDIFLTDEEYITYCLFGISKVAVVAYTMLAGSCSVYIDGAKSNPAVNELLAEKITNAHNANTSLSDSDIIFNYLKGK